MTPREERRQANGGCEASEKGLALEAAIRRINSVVSVRVSCGPAGDVASVDVLIGRGAASKRVVRDVESACMACLGHRLATGALSVTRMPGSPTERDPASDRPQPGDSEIPEPGLAKPEPQGGEASSPEARRSDETGFDAGMEKSGAQPVAAKKYRVISRAGAASEVGARHGGRSRADKASGENARSEPRIGVRQIGINVHPDRIRATVELSCAGRTFTGECDGIPTEENRFTVPAGAAIKALDRAFGGLVGVSVDDVQLCRLSGRKTAVVLATVGSPWGDVPSTGASFATRSEEEAVIRALLHAVNRCVMLTFGGEDSGEGF